MEPIEKTIHCRMMDSKHKLLFTLALTRPHYQFTQNRINLSARMWRWKEKKQQRAFYMIFFLCVFSSTLFARRQRRRQHLSVFAELL